jgi:hypothetical protein
VLGFINAVASHVLIDLHVTDKMILHQLLPAVSGKLLKLYLSAIWSNGIMETEDAILLAKTLTRPDITLIALDI